MSPYYEVGRYRVRVTSQALGKAKTGTPQFALRFLVLEDEHGESVNQYERTMYRYITDKTIEYFKQDLQALGFSGGSFKMLDPAQSGFHDFRGLELMMYCSHEDDQNGDPRERWGIDRGGSELKVDPLEPKALRELDSLFGKHLKDLRPERPPQPAAQMATSIADDDVPF